MDKKQLSEEDVKRLFITPAIEAQWHKNRIRMEAKITDGRMNIKGNLAVRNTPKKADYLLYTASGHPIAVVEATQRDDCSAHNGASGALADCPPPVCGKGKRHT